MKKAQLLILIFIAFIFTLKSKAQNTIEVDCKNIFLSGANIAWDKFGRDIGAFNFDNPTNTTAPNYSIFNNHFSQIKAAGGNSIRWWLHTDAAFTPEIETSGNVTGLSVALTNEEIIAQIKGILDLAWENEIYVNITLFSFDLLSSPSDQPNSSINFEGNKKFLESANNIQSYIDNALTPMVIALKDHPALLSWEIFNEPEGMSSEFGWTGNQGGAFVTMADIQVAVNKIAGAIHDIDPDAIVTNGAWSMLSNTDVDLGFNFAEQYQKNYYSDTELINAGGATNGTLDYYQVHYYQGNMPNSTSPLHNDASHWELDKPIMLGEFHAADLKVLALQNGYDENGAYQYIYDRGYFGAWGWQWYQSWLKVDIEPQINYMFTNNQDLVTSNLTGCPSSLQDNDYDGVMDDIDICLNTPFGEIVNSTGCSEVEASDDDSDGVINGQDKCPNSPLGESVDTNGCTVDELADNDNDGVINGIDLCQSTPINEDVDTKGCSSSQLDDDNDGVVNFRDYCEHTPEGATVDGNGCTPEQIYNDLHLEDFDIRYNQVSYLVDRDKLITFSSYKDFEPINYTIFNDLNEEVLSGQTDVNSYWNDARRYINTIDVSSLNTEGDFRLVTTEKEITFKIRRNKYNELAKASLKYFYYNRASMEIEPPYSGHYSRAPGHMDTEVVVHASGASDTRPEGTIISSSKGWYDAGDYNKYVVNSGISTYTLMAAYEHYKEYYDALELNIPEKGGDLPDILDEVLWNLDWMLTMQDPGDGGVYHKLAGDNVWRGYLRPIDDDYGGTRYVVMKTTAAALNFAAVTAVASRIFANFENIKPGFSASLLQASKNAFTWAKNNPSVAFAAQNAGGVGGGNYGDGSFTDELIWAASELYITTLDSTYASDINAAYINYFPQWRYTSMLAGISLTHHSATVSGGVDMGAVESKLLNLANSYRSNLNNNEERMVPLTGQWGSNGDMSNMIIVLIRAYEISNDITYLSAAYIAVDYLFGRNGTGYSYITGYGDKTPLYPHHRISHTDIVSNPIPGMLVGGPNSFQQDSNNCPEYPNNYRASSYVDLLCSYASNEVAINWNAPFAYVINALQFYQGNIYPDKSDSLLDDDHDGVLNTEDLCQNTPLGESVDTKGCSQTQLDDDYDRVTNNLDLCPETAIGEEVDGNGCSIANGDDDSDGVINSLDQCPDTPSGSTVNEDGCKVIYIADPIFEQELINLGIDSDGKINQQIIESDTYEVFDLRVYNLGINDLTGIEAFKSLKVLWCQQNNITSLDLSQNTDLTILFCHTNQLTSLDVSSNINLNQLGCGVNQLTELDVSNNLELTYLSCERNKLNELSVSPHVNLTYLGISQNQFTSIDISNNTALTEFWGRENNLASLNVSQNPLLNTLDIVNTDIISLDLSNNPNLITIYAWNSNLESLNLRNGNNGNITNFQVTNSPNLTCIQVDDAVWSNENWTNIDVHHFFSEDCGDDDEDGVLNDEDICPSTPTGETVDATGCSESQLDDDEDGVMNDEDICPSTPTGETVDATGCSESQFDDDDDGVINDEDICPSTPTGETVGATGCSESQIDDDGDGVMNDKDLYPNTPEGANVDANGGLLIDPSLFNISWKSSTCPNINNAEINIQINQSYPVDVTVTGPGGFSKINNNQVLTSPLVLTELASGQYQVSFSFTNDLGADYNGYTLNIAEAPQVTGKAIKTDKEAKTATFNVSGDKSYLIYANGEYLREVTFLDESVHEIVVDNLFLGENYVKIMPKNACRGMVEQWITILGHIQFYPNPTQDLVTLKGLTSEEVNIQVFNTARSQLFKNKYKTHQGMVTFSLENKPSGVYIVKVIGNKNDTVEFKVIKK